MSSIGLGHLTRMKVVGCPRVLGYYVVNNFDSDAMVLRLPRGDIPITRELVHHLRGLPLEETYTELLQFREKDDDTVALWKEQFQGSSDIRPKGIQKATLNTTEPDLIFKVNLFGLLCNIIGQSKSIGTCDLSMLSKVRKDLDLKEIDWCSYVLKGLKDTRWAWNPNSDTSYYVGPILLLMLLYLEYVHCDEVPVQRGTPSICFWNVDEMRKRELWELSHGGFGLGDL